MKTKLICCSDRTCKFNDSCGKCNKDIVALNDKGVCIFHGAENKLKGKMPFDLSSCQ